MSELFNNSVKRRYLMIFLILFALFLRVYGLNNFPAGFNADEAAIGYNAFSIINTGRDEYGEALPLSFKSFGDYKPGLYFYLVIPFVAVLGLSEWAVRLPSALLGTGTVILIYFLAKEIFADRKTSFFCALFLSINPWAIHYSRGGWESNAAVFFIALGTYLFIKGLSKKNYLFLGLISFLVSMYLYQSPRLVIPFFIFMLVLIFRKKLGGVVSHSLKFLAVSGFILLLLSVPIILQFTSGQGSARFAGLSSFMDVGPVNRVNELRGQHKALNSIIPLILHNKISAYLPNFLGHYLDHFSADFLFINGDPLIRNKIPETGQFYLIQSLFLIAGLFFLIKFESKLKYIIVIWAITAPLASSITYQTPSALRALSLVIPLTLIMGFGFVSLLRLIYSKKTKFVAGILFLVIVGYEFSHYLESYYVHSPKRYPLAWEYGFREMVTKLNKYEGEFKKVVITDRYDQPYILVLFFKQYDPKKYQPQAILSERDKFNFGTVRSFDKFEFHKITKEEILNNPDTLFIATPEEAGDAQEVIDKVYFPNGENAFIFVKS